MSAHLQSIYDELLMRHIRDPKGYQALNPEGPRTEIHNPFCGDRLSLEDGETVQFECECCGISMGAASLMTLMVRGASPAQKRQRALKALAVLKGEAPVEDDLEGIPSALRDEAWAGWQLLQEISRVVPGRRTCASLGWQALLASLNGEHDVIATEIKG